MINRVARNCHGKSNNFAAKDKDSRQKEEPHGQKKKKNYNNTNNKK